MHIWVTVLAVTHGQILIKRAQFDLFSEDEKLVCDKS